jgi:hypothetical protein
MTDNSLTLFRVVNHNPPIVSDFYSHEQLGRPLRDPTMKDLWTGVSMFSNIAEARAIARPGRSQSKWIAEVRISDGIEGVRIKRTGGNHTTHHTVWAMPELLSARVIRMHPISP